MLDPSVFKTTRRETFHILLPEAEFLRILFEGTRLSPEGYELTGVDVKTTLSSHRYAGQGTAPKKQVTIRLLGPFIHPEPEAEAVKQITAMNDYIQDKYGDSADDAAKAKDRLIELSDAFFAKGDQLKLTTIQLMALWDVIRASEE
jgi:hypothetical protein